MATSDRYLQIVANFEEAYEGSLRLGRWAEAVQTRSQIATWAMQKEGRAAYFAQIDRAIQLADDHELFDASARLRIQRSQYSLMSSDTGASLEELKRGLPQLLSSLASTLVLRANQCLALEDRVTAGEYFASAARLAEDLPPPSRWQIELNYSEYLAGESKIEEALRHAEKTLQLARQRMGSPTEVVGQALIATTLLRTRLGTPDQIPRAESELAELKSFSPPTAWITALCLRSQCRFEQRRFEDALADADAALAAGPDPYWRRLALLARVLALGELGRRREALAAAREALNLFDASERSEPPSSRSAAQTTLGENMHLVAAWLNDCVDGSPAETFALVESGRARNLSRELSRLAGHAEPASAVSFAQLHAMLVEDSAALLFFGVIHWGTLAVLVDFAHPEPRVFRLNFAARDLKRMLARPDLGEDSRAWTEVVYGALPELSTALLHPLADALGQLAGCKALYIAPDSFLYRAPFAALTFPAAPGADESRPVHLIERFALAYAPSAAVLASCRARRSAPGRDCLAYGMGEAGGLYFAQQAREVSQLPWNSSRLLDERTKPADLLANAANFNVIHLACHGATAEHIYDPLKASLLEMFPPDCLLAGDVFAADPPLQADLVFLNACQSGRFRMSSHSEPDGFWRSFLKAGARSLLATLTHVDPAQANSLALAFYGHWLAKQPKASALQTAQLDLIRAGASPEHWGSHVLIGDAW